MLKSHLNVFLLFCHNYTNFSGERFLTISAQTLQHHLRLYVPTKPEGYQISYSVNPQVPQQINWGCSPRTTFQYHFGSDGDDDLMINIWSYEKVICKSDCRKLTGETSQGNQYGNQTISLSVHPMPNTGTCKIGRASCRERV